MFKFLTILSVTLALLSTCSAAVESNTTEDQKSPTRGNSNPWLRRRTYKMTDNVVGKYFYDWFVWENHGSKDPTHGRVNYPDFETSRQLNTTYATRDTFILRADDTRVLDPKGPGRDSARIRSKKTFTKHVAIFDVRHMPQGCGTWPAIWEVKGDDWPNGGEIDILEGVNDQANNFATLHTTTGCTMPERRFQAGINGQLDCDWLVNWNTGCTVQFRGNHTYGPSFNQIGGGWYALERYEDAINVWFWPRNSVYVPPDVKYPLGLANPITWGIPMANFPNTQCDLEKFFKEHTIVINLTFCGDWAGAVYGQMGCPGTCVDHVNNNPQAFKDAYFDIASIRIFQ